MSSERGGQSKGASSAVLDPTMSLVGRLEDLSLGEILQIVSLSKRSGLLRLEAPGGKASLYIRAGKVIYAATTEEKEGILSLFVENNLIEADQLEALRADLDSISSPREFRALLEERTGVGNDRFQDVLKKRVENLTYSLFVWEEGTFSFQLIEDESTHPLLSKVAPFFLDEGIGAQFLVMEGARLKDEMMRDAAAGAPEPRTPMVDPDTVLGDDWQEEFEQHLAGPSGEAGEETPPEVVDEGLDDFDVPEKLPPLSGAACEKVVAVGLPAAFVVEITGAFVRAGIELLVHDNGADALTNIQQLRQQGQNPYLLVDLEAAGITDGRAFGGLETVSTMWDFGFHLPVGLVCRKELEEDLEGKLQTVTGLTVFRLTDPADRELGRMILETVSGTRGREAGSPLEGAEAREPGTGPETQADSVPQDGPREHGEPEEKPSAVPAAQAEEYYDIEQEFSEELGDIDLPIDAWDGDQGMSQEASQDPHMARLSSYVNELNNQDISGEITLLALRFASAFTSRAILFLVRKEDMRGLGQFGVDLGQDIDADSVVRSLNLLLEEDSIFQRVANHRQSYKGPPTGSGTEKTLFASLGGGVPKEIFVGPVVSMGKVAVLLYGDDYPACQGLEPTHTLDIFLSHVGLALDRAFLEMKLKSQRS